MPVSEKDVEQLTQNVATAANGDNTVASNDPTSALSAAAGVIPNRSFVGSNDPQPTAPGPYSDTNAAPQPSFFTGSWKDKLAAVVPHLSTRMDPMSALVAGSLIAMNPNTPSPFGSISAQDVARGGAPTPSTTPSPRQPSNAQTLINNLGASLGDVAAVGDRQPGEAPIVSAMRVLKTGSERQQREQENRVKLATANAQMLHEQMLVHRLGQEEVDKAVEMGSASMNEALTAPGAERVATDKTSDEMKDLMLKKNIDPSGVAFFASGKKQVGVDANGLPVMRTTYSAVKPGRPFSPSADQINFLNKYIPGSDFKTPEEAKEDGQEPQQFDWHTWVMLNQKAMNNMGNVMAMQKLNDETEEKNLDLVLRKGAGKFLQLPIVQQAQAMVGQNGSHDPFMWQKTMENLQQLMVNPSHDPKIEQMKQEMLNAFPDWIKQAKSAFGGGNIAKYDDQETKYNAIREKVLETSNDLLTKAENDPKEIEGHTPAYQAAFTKIMNDPAQPPERRAKAKEMLQVVDDVRQRELDYEEAKAKGKKSADTGFQGNQSASTPEEFFSSLAPTEQALVREIGTGRAVLSRLDYLATRRPEVLEAVARSYPDFDSSKAQAYPAAYRDFTSGKPNTTGGALNSGGTALKHLRDLKAINDNDPILVRTPGTQAYNAYHNLLDTVTGELAQFYQLPKTDSSIESMKSTLGATLNRDAAIARQAKSMGEKFDSYEQTWRNAAPSPSYQAPMPHVDQEAIKSRALLDPDYAAAHPEVLAQDNQQKQAQQRQAQTHGGALPTPKPQPSTVPPGKFAVTVEGHQIYFDSQQQADAFKQKYGIK